MVEKVRQDSDDDSERAKPGTSAATVNLDFLPNSARGHYIFALSSTLTCEKNQVFKLGLSGNIKKRFSSYSITEPWGNQLVAILNARKSMDAKELRAFEKKLFEALLKHPGIRLLKTTARVKKSGEWITGKWADIQDAVFDFYTEHEEDYPRFKDMEENVFRDGIVLFKRSKKKTKCTDVKTH